MHNYEVEIKVLLSSKENKDKFKEKLKHKLIDLKFLWKNSQLNHYFIGWDFDKLKDNIIEKLPKEKQKTLKDILSLNWEHSFRTRYEKWNSILVIKLAVDDTTSSNWIARLEWEHIFKNMKIDDLDKVLLDSDFEYQAKWSREREEYKSKNWINITIDKNAWYWYLSEFEMVVSSREEAEKAEESIRKLLDELELAELNQDKLAKMFDYYNENWKNYYWTDKYFILENDWTIKDYTHK